MIKKIFAIFVCAFSLLSATPKVEAILLTDPIDARSWQGATVGTFVGLYFGSDPLANPQQVIDNQLLDDGIFDLSGYIPASLISGGSCPGTSLDSTRINLVDRLMLKRIKLLKEANLLRLYLSG
jgi:hypothetical protein